MAPEYGATCGFFPVDEVTLDYLRLSGRPADTVQLVEAYCKAQGLWREPGVEPVFSDSLELVTDIPTDLPDVYADQRRMRQVLLGGPQRCRRIVVPRPVALGQMVLRIQATQGRGVGLHLQPLVQRHLRPIQPA